MNRFLLGLFCALSMSAAHADIAVTDDSGATLRLAAPARRIVSLAPHITEALFAAGAGEWVVGAVEYSDYPEGANAIRRVGGYTRVDLEAVIALKPDLVIGWQSGNEAAQMERLKAFGVPIYLTQPNRIEDIAHSIEDYGRLAGTKAAASAAAQRFRARLGQLRERAEGRPAVRVFYQAWKNPLTTVSGKQIISDAIRLCGGVNVFADLAGLAPNVSVEAVLTADPEAIVASGMGEQRPEWLDDWRRWTQMSAVVHDNLFFIPPDLIQRHTPRLLDGIERLCALLETARGRRGKPH